MKILVSVFLITLVFVIAAFAQTAASPSPPQQQLSPALQEAARLNGEIVKLFGQKKFAEALPLAIKVITIREFELGKNNLTIAQSYWNLANIQLALNNRKDAEKSFEIAFDVYEKNQPLAVSDERNFVQVLEMTAYSQAVKGEFDKAEKRYQRAVESSEKLYGKDALETAKSLSKLADLYQAKSDYEKASPLLLRALEIKNQEKSTGNNEIDEIFESVSCVLTKLGREQEIKEIRNRVYPQRQPQDADMLASLINAGVINGKALNLITPPYPAEAREKRVSGMVEVKVLINESGDVIRACAVKGAKELQRASELAAYASKFSPTIFNGKPTRVTGKIIYKFVAR